MTMQVDPLVVAITALAGALSTIVGKSAWTQYRGQRNGNGKSQSLVSLVVEQNGMLKTLIASVDAREAASLRFEARLVSILEAQNVILQRLTTGQEVAAAVATERRG